MSAAADHACTRSVRPSCAATAAFRAHSSAILDPARLIYGGGEEERGRKEGGTKGEEEEGKEEEGEG